MIALVLGFLNLTLTSLVLIHLGLRGRPLKSFFKSSKRVSQRGLIQVNTPIPVPIKAPTPQFPMTFRSQGGVNEVLVSYYRSKGDTDAPPFIAKHIKRQDFYVDEFGHSTVGESFREQFQPAAIAEVRRRTPGVAKAINRDIVMSSDVIGDPMTGVTFDNGTTDATP